MNTAQVLLFNAPFFRARYIQFPVAPYIQYTIALYPIKLGVYTIHVLHIHPFLLFRSV